MSWPADGQPRFKATHGTPGPLGGPAPSNVLDRANAHRIISIHRTHEFAQQHADRLNHKHAHKGAET